MAERQTGELNNMTVIGNRYREARKELRMNLAQASEKLGISVRELLKYERREKYPHILMLMRMAGTYGHSIDWLVGRDVEQ